MAERTTAQKRTDLKVEVSKALKSALFDLRMTYEDLAKDCGVCTTKVGSWCDPKSKELPCLATLAMFRPELAQAILPLLTRTHGIAVVKRCNIDATTADHFARFSEIATKTARLTTEYATALGDGHVDLVEEKRVAVALAELRNEADSQLHAIGARQRGLRAVAS